MNILKIVTGNLYTIQYQNQDLDELNRLYEQWRDTTYLYNFFHEQRHDLFGPFYDYTCTEKAVKETIKEANYLFKKLISIAESGNDDPYYSLQNLFQPLSDTDYKLKVYQKSKVKGPNKKSWLRIYAIRIDTNTFVITGGAIKLTRTMNERSHTDRELQKLKIARDHLRNMGLLFKEDFLILE
jgi:hypothetical protein